MMRRFCSGSVTPRSAREEALLRAHGAELHVALLAEQPLDLLALARAQQAVVDEDAGAADRRPRGAPARRRPTNRRRPRARRAPGAAPTRSRMRRTSSSMKASIVQEPAQPQMRCAKFASICAPPSRVRHLGVEEQAPDRALAVADRREGRALAACRARGSPSGRRSTRSPWLIQTTRSAPPGRPAKSGSSPLELEQRAAVLAVLAASRPRRRGGASAAACRSRCRAAGGRARATRGIEVGRARVEHARGPAREHDAGGIAGARSASRDERRRMDLAVDVLLADAAARSAA